LVIALLFTVGGLQLTSPRTFFSGVFEIAEVYRNPPPQKKARTPKLIPEKSIKGNMASSGMFANAEQTFSSNNFKTAKKQTKKKYALGFSIEIDLS